MAASGNIRFGKFALGFLIAGLLFALRFNRLSFG